VQYERKIGTAVPSTLDRAARCETASPERRATERAVVWKSSPRATARRILARMTSTAGVTRERQVRVSSYCS
jgi:hypothetical protein